MDEEEIDSWYEEQKQKCLDDYMKCIEEGKNKEKAQKEYDEKLSRLIEKYNSMMDEKLKNKKPDAFSSLSLKIKGLFKGR